MVAADEPPRNPLPYRPANMNKATSFFAVLLVLGSACLAQAKPPNVVMIISDDQTWGDFSFMGHPHIQTPHLDRLAKQSVVYTRGYVPSSLCRPSLATLITGLYPHQHGITGNDPPKGTNRQLMLKHIQSHSTLPQMLAKKGYRSLQTGKWWEGHPKLGGFTHAMTHGDPKRGGRHGDLGLQVGRKGLKPIFDFIDQGGDQPFFVWYAPFLPHSPHNPPARLLDKYKDKTDSIHIARYWAMCEWFDETCGELLGHLDRKGLSDNTLVVFVTDNGWIQQPKSPRYAPKSKRSPYDGGLRTPIMLRWPGKLRPKHNEETLVNSVDLVPTILAACGLEPTKKMLGLDLIGQANDELKRREAIFGEIFEHDVADIDRPEASLLHRWCIEGNWKLILSTGDRGPELFDLHADPWETKNLAGKNPKMVKQLSNRLDTWWSPGR